MEINFLAIIVASFSTLLLGFVWYGPLFGKIWMKENGFVEEELKQENMFKIFGLTLLFSILIAFMMQPVVIHEFGAFGMINGAEETALPSYKAFMNDYAGKHRAFSHGAFHGTIMGLLFVFPLLAINGLFERKSWKYILIHSGYWIVCLAVIGAIVCGWK